MKKRLNIVLYVIVLFLLLYNLVIYTQKILNPNKVPNFLGFKNFIILTGSMEDTLSIGDIIFVKEKDEIKVDDIISFEEKNSMVTHRVIDIIEEDGKIFYKTKGDANKSIDTVLTEKKDVEGVYSFKIPKIGSIIIFFQNWYGVVILLILTFAIYFSINNNDKNEKVSKH